MAVATGEAEVVEPRSSKGPHSSDDGNPLGWLALGRGARGRGFERSSGVHFWFRSARSPRDAGGFNEPNKTVVK